MATPAPRNKDCSLVSAIRVFFCLALLIPVAFSAAAFSTETAPKATYRSTVESIITELRPKPDLHYVERFIREVPAMPPSATLEQKAEVLSRYIFDRWKIRADNTYASRSNKDNVLPDSVLAAHQGHCLGLTTLYLLAAEARGLTPMLVRAPDHVFPRLCDKKMCIDVEPLRNGKIVDDSYYITNLTIPKQALAQHIYLRSLDDPRELAASIYLGLGFITAQAHQIEVAELFYKRAIENSPQFAEAYSDLAGVESQLVGADEALRLLKNALELNPTHYATLLNLGIYYQSKSEVTQALTYYDRALEANPLAAQVYRKRSQLYATQGKLKEALLDLEKALVIQPDLCDVREARMEIRRKLNLPAEDKELVKLREGKRCLE